MTRLEEEVSVRSMVGLADHSPEELRCVFYCSLSAKPSETLRDCHVLISTNNYAKVVRSQAVFRIATILAQFEKRLFTVLNRSILELFLSAFWNVLRRFRDAPGSLRDGRGDRMDGIGHLHFKPRSQTSSGRDIRRDITPGLYLLNLSK